MIYLKDGLLWLPNNILTSLNASYVTISLLLSLQLLSTVMIVEESLQKREQVNMRHALNLVRRNEFVHLKRFSLKKN